MHKQSGNKQSGSGLRQWLNHLTIRWFGKPLTRVLDYCVGVPLVGALALMHRRRAFPSGIERVGVLCSPTMGDTVLFSAVLLDLRAHFGTAVEIVHVCGSKNLLAAELLRGANWHIVIDLTRPRLAMRQLRAERLDVLFDFSSWQRVTAALALTSQSRYTVGFRSAGQHRGRGYDVTVTHRADQHELDNFRDLLRGAGIRTAAEPQITVSDVALREAWQEERDIVAFHPWPAGGPQSLREWPEEHWWAIATKLARPGTVFAITGSPAERARSEAFAERLASAANVRAAVFTGGDGLRQLVTLLRKARLVVSVNTGVMHLAAVAGAPTVSLNGPTAERRWGPRGRCCVGVAPADGSGGYLHFGFEFHHRMPDVMNRITADQVLDASSILLARCGHPV